MVPAACNILTFRTDFLVRSFILSCFPPEAVDKSRSELYPGPFGLFKIRYCCISISVSPSLSMLSLRFADTYCTYCSFSSLFLYPLSGILMSHGAGLLWAHARMRGEFRLASNDLV